jgi:DNA-binding response OmpR family regulator
MSGGRYPASRDLLRVLVVEDEYELANRIADALVERGAEVLGPAATLEEARRLFEFEPADCAIVDYDLGSSIVLPLTAGLRRREIPFVAVTGSQGDEPERESGELALVHKPFSNEQLAEALQELFGSE